MNTYIVAGFVTFISVFLKGFQYKNVIAKQMKWVVITSYLMATCDVLVIGMVSKSGYDIIIPCGTGAAIGMYVSMTLHDRIFGAADKAPRPHYDLSSTAVAKRYMTGEMYPQLHAPSIVVDGVPYWSREDTIKYGDAVEHGCRAHLMSCK